jgi:hypothetical protein
MTFEDKAEAEANRFNEKPGRTSAKWLGIVVAVVLLLTVLGNALGIVSVFWSAEKAKITAAPRVTSKVYETENIIAKVTLFHEKCTDVIADLNTFQNNYQRYVADKEALKGATGLEAQSGREALPNDVSDYTAALNVAQSDAATYNAEAANPTAAEFRTIFSQHGLPVRIDLPPGAAAADSYHLNCG